MAAPGLPSVGWSKARLRGKGIRALRSILRAAKGITGSGPLEWHTRTFGSKDYLSAGGLRQVLIRTVNEDLTDSARAVVCPVLLLWGAEDTETPLWLAHRFQELMNGRSTLETLPHKDHYLYTGTGAHLCAYKIRTWLQAHETGHS
jgi:pimeloyl-ACP methyl ester carboxylesterase